MRSPVGLGVEEAVEADDAVDVGLGHAQAVRDGVDGLGADVAGVGLDVPEQGQQGVAAAPGVGGEEGVEWGGAHWLTHPGWLIHFFRHCDGVCQWQDVQQKMRIARLLRSTPLWRGSPCARAPGQSPSSSLMQLDGMKVYVTLASPARVVSGPPMSPGTKAFSCPLPARWIDRLGTVIFRNRQPTLLTPHFAPQVCGHKQNTQLPLRSPTSCFRAQQVTFIPARADLIPFRWS